MVIIVMGVSGSGKSTIGRALAEAMEGQFFDGDDFHPAANIAKMRAGHALTDADRLPWLQRLRQLIVEQEGNSKPSVIACSALRESYRKILDDNGRDRQIKYVFLDGSFELIKARMDARSGHFMPESLLRSQFDTLEVPSNAIRVDISQPLSEVVSQILRILGLR